MRSVSCSMGEAAAVSGEAEAEQAYYLGLASVGAFMDLSLVHICRVHPLRCVQCISSTIPIPNTIKKNHCLYQRLRECLTDKNSFQQL
jgi:hypothetical protein